jgi:hypothetical protein
LTANARFFCFEGIKGQKKSARVEGQRARSRPRGR